MVKALKIRAMAMEDMRKEGFLTGTTEHYNMFQNVRQDLFGFIDFIALGHGQIIAVQCCAVSGAAAHRKKIATDCFEPALAWLKGGGKIELYSAQRKEVPKVSGEGTKTIIERRTEEIGRTSLEMLHAQYST